MTDQPPVPRPEEDGPDPSPPPPPPPAPLGATPPPLEGAPRPTSAPPEAGRAPVRGRGRGPRRRYRAFNFGRVLSGTFTLYFRKLPVILLLAVVILGPVSVFEVMVNTPSYESWDGEEETYDAWAAQVDEHDPERWEVPLFLLNQLSQMLLTGVIAYLVVRHAQKRPVGLAEAVGRGFSRFFPMVGAVVLVYLVLGAMFLPGIIMIGIDATMVGILFVLIALVPAAMWFYATYVTLPAAAVEGLGPIESIKRSRQLAIGHRWQLFALNLVVGIIAYAAVFIIMVPVLAATDFHDGEPALWILAGFKIAVIGPLTSVMMALVYIELREVTEGVDVDGIAEVFA